MLHIFLTILKIIGWIILAILGVLVLLICVVFFVPLRYRAEGKGDGTIDSLWGRLKFSWLLHLVSGQAEYQNGKFFWNIRIAWKKISSGTETIYEETETMMKEPERQPEPQQADTVLDRPALEERPAPATEKSTDCETETLSDKVDKTTKQSENQAENQSEKPKKETWYKRICKKFQEFFRKIKYTFRKICGTIRALVQKKERLTEFLGNEIHKTAFTAVIKETKRLLRFLAPHKWNANLHFGFEDPSITGYLLAFISMIHPFVGEHTVIRPDFEEQVLEGNLMIAGKIRVFYLIIAAWNLIWNKNVRITYKHIRDFKF